MVSNIAKDLSHLRHLPEGLHTENLRRRICIAVILTSETPNIAQETTISLVARGKVDLATSIHTMIGDVAIVLLTIDGCDVAYDSTVDIVAGDVGLKAGDLDLDSSSLI